MSNPSFSNIDLWLFELAEGNLTPSQVEQLELFLLQHPEFDVDRDVWEMTKVNSPQAEYVEPEGLIKKRPIGWFNVVNTAAVGLLLIIGVSNYFNSNPVAETKLAENSHDLVKQKLLEEIRQIRASYKNENGPAISSSNSDNLNSIQNQTPLLASLVSVGATTNNSLGNDSEESNIQNSADRGQSGNINRPNTLNNLNQLTNNLSVSGLPNMENIIDRSLATHIPKQVDVFTENSHTNIVAHSNPSRVFGSDDYKLSFKSKLMKFGRKVQRMMDNPIALKNYRDPYYHVPGLLPNDVNFSSTGTMLSTRVQAISRLQWYGQENEQLLSQVAIDGYVYGMRGGLGIQLNHSMYNDGKLNIANVALTYSPKISLTKKISLEPSLRFKMGNKSFENSMKQEVDMVELDRNNAHEFFANGEISNGNDLWYKDLGAGLMINTEWFFIGAQVDNLFRHKDNLYTNDATNPRRAGYHFVGTIGTDWTSRRENVSLSPYFVYQNMENLSEAWLGANLRLNWFTIGGAVSSNADPSASMGMKFKHFALTYNADYTKSAMTGNRALSHQLSLRFVSKPSRFGRRLLNL